VPRGRIFGHVGYELALSQARGHQLFSHIPPPYLGTSSYLTWLKIRTQKHVKIYNDINGRSFRTVINIIFLCLGALDRCYSDDEQRDWIHKEVACALSSACNIIPVFDNFVMPDPELLPETMRAVTSYNGVKWIHDYQEACVDKVN